MLPIENIFSKFSRRFKSTKLAQVKHNSSHFRLACSNLDGVLTKKNDHRRFLLWLPELFGMFFYVVCHHNPLPADNFKR